MTEVQKKILQLLLTIDRICRENDIEYFLAGGTALGAVRNGGFLPWDDDADILIKRSEFEKLDNAMKKTDLPGMEWVTEWSHPTYRNPTARLFDLSSTDILISRMDYRAPQGLQAEVFIMDPYPNDSAEQSSFKKYLWLYSEVTNHYLLYGSLRMPEDMLDQQLYDYYRDRLDKVGYDQVRAELLEKFTYPEDECDYYCGRWGCMPYVFKKEWMAKPRYVEFEGYSLPVPDGVLYEMVENYDANWDIIPPPAKRKTHPSLSSAEIPFAKYADQRRRLCDEVQYNDVLAENKEDRLKRLFARERIERSFADIRLVYLQQIADKLNQKDWHFQKKQLEELEKEFEEYFLCQFKYSYYKYGKAATLHEDLFECMFWTLLYRNRFENAAVLAKLYPGFSKAESFLTICEMIGDLKIAKYNKDKGRVKELLTILQKQNGLEEQLEVKRAAFWLKTQDKMRLRKVKKYLADYPDEQDLEIRKYFGDLYFAAGDKDTAKSYYRDVLKKSRNGMILYELKKRGIKI